MSAANNTQYVEAPARVPPGLVFDFDYLTDPRLQGADLHDGLLSLARESSPIFYSRHHGGRWVARGYQAIFDISRNG